MANKARPTGEMSINMNVDGHKGKATLSVIPEHTSAGRPLTQEETSNLNKPPKPTLADVLTGYGPLGEAANAFADKAPQMSLPKPDKPPNPAPVETPKAISKPVRVKFETEAGAIWEDCQDLKSATERAYDGTHDGVLQKIHGRMIFHAPHTVHRAIIDL
jgi:hypothetical protein